MHETFGMNFLKPSQDIEQGLLWLATQRAIQNKFICHGALCQFHEKPRDICMNIAIQNADHVLVIYLGLKCYFASKT